MNKIFDIFDKKLLKEWANCKPPKVTYAIGYDCFDIIKAYCLTKIIDGKIQIILQKSIVEKTTGDEKSEFDIEVENLSKYFNAKIYKEL